MGLLPKTPQKLNHICANMQNIQSNLSNLIQQAHTDTELGVQGHFKQISANVWPCHVPDLNLYSCLFFSKAFEVARIKLCPPITKFESEQSLLGNELSSI